MYRYAFLAAAAVPLVAGHGFVTSPPARRPGAAYGAACGAQALNQQAADINGNVQGIMQVVDVSALDTTACNLWLCKGFPLEDPSLVQSYTLGQSIDFEVDIAAPHTGVANVSVVRTSSNTIIGTPLIEFTNYASTATGVDPSNRAFSVTLPSDLEGECTTAGDCVLQWWWDAEGINQTYESCVDFTVAGSGSPAPAPSVSAPAPSASSPAATSVAAPPATTAAAPQPTSTPIEEDDECPADDEEDEDEDEEPIEEDDECPADDDEEEEPVEEYPEEDDECPAEDDEEEEPVEEEPVDDDECPAEGEDEEATDVDPDEEYEGVDVDPEEDDECPADDDEEEEPVEEYPEEDDECPADEEDEDEDEEPVEDDECPADDDEEEEPVEEDPEEDDECPADDEDEETLPVATSTGIYQRAYPATTLATLVRRSVATAAY